MRFANPTLFLFVFFFFIVTCVVQREAAVAKERVVSGSSGSNSVTIVRGECEKQGVECKKVNGGNEDYPDLENEDYIYTNSVLP